MLFTLLVSLVLLTPSVEQTMNCSAPSEELTACGHHSPNGCCAKGCMRNAGGRCVPELCTFTWNGWLKRPVTMSCYFHWFLLIFATFIFTLMLLLLVCNMTYEMRRCMRRRPQSRYVRFTVTSSPSISIV